MSDPTDRSDQTQRLSDLLRAVAGMADGTAGRALWTGLADTLTDPPGPGDQNDPAAADGSVELAALRAAPDDADLATELARVVLRRAEADPAFRARFDSWRAQPQVRVVEQAVAAPAPAPPGRRDAAVAFARRMRPHLSGPWTIAIAGGLVVTVLGGLILNAISASGSDRAGGDTPAAHRTGPPVAVAGVQVVPSPTTDGTILPDPVRLTAAELAQVNGANGESFAALVRAHHGVPTGPSIVSVPITGNADQPVRIVDVKVVGRTCTAPLGGTYFYTGGPQGEGDVIAIRFDLDLAQPVATAADGRPYFATHTITLVPGEQQTLTFTSVTKSSYCQFRFQLVVLVGSRTVTEEVGDGTEAFAVVAKQRFDRYTVLYVGGMLHPDPTAPRGWSFVAQDPATYQGTVVKPSA